jgi:NAD+ diphosphatase
MQRPSFAFVEGALDRADHLRDDPDALATLWPQARVVLIDEEGRALTDASQQLFAPRGSTLANMPPAAIFLGRSGEHGWFAARAEEIAANAPQRIDLRSAASAWPAFEATLFAQACACATPVTWHRSRGLSLDR